MKNLKQNHPESPSFVIPDLCQTTSLLLLILISELSVLAWTLLDYSFSWMLFALRSLLVQWIVLLCAAALCRLRPYLCRCTIRQGWLLCFAVIMTINIVLILSSYRAVFGIWIPLSRFAQQLFAIVIITAMVLRYFQLQQLLLDQHQAELSARMNALQARIKPHFLFNSLNTIAQLIATRPAEAETAVENLASLFRANLKETTTFCPLRQELNLVKGYLALEQWRFGERLKLDWQESLHDDSCPVPVLCLQPLVENAVVHGVASTLKGGKLIVRILQTPRITTLSVENDLVSGKTEHEGHGVGLTNVQHRLQVLYGDRARCRIEKTAASYKVIVTIPMTE